MGTQAGEPVYVTTCPGKGTRSAPSGGVKPYVICHMMPSVDGRLRTKRWNIPDRAHQEYERTAEILKGDAWICGRKTMAEFAHGRRVPRKSRAAEMPRTDYIVPRVKGETYAVAIDTHGKLPWSERAVEGDPLIVALTEDVADSYLTFLRDKGISYLFAGTHAGTLQLKRALDTLRRAFGVKRLLLEGGGETNGAFLRAGLIDELSLLITPAADGGIGEPSLFDAEGRHSSRALASLSIISVRRIGAGMIWARYRVGSAKD